MKKIPKIPTYPPQMFTRSRDTDTDYSTLNLYFTIIKNNKVGVINAHMQKGR
jgi:hypothetical protein